MPLSAERKLDLLGVALVLLVVLGTGLAVYGALDIAGQDGSETPSINFTAERVNDTHVAIVHDGGDVVRGEELVLTIDGRDRVPAERFPTSVSDGDAAVLQAREGRTVRVYWTGGSGPRDRLDSVTT